MSGVAIARYLLANHAGLAEVTITAGHTPLGTLLPAVSLRTISSVTRNPVAPHSPGALVTERVQVTAEAMSYASAKATLALCRAALPYTHGTVNGFACDSITPDVDGPDMEDAETGIFSQSQDFMVRFAR